MLYFLVRALLGLAIRSFYRVDVVFSRGADLSGPVMLVGNHPNSLVDPALVFVAVNRQVTFLAREPLFRIPFFGWLLRGLGALPVYRKQDHPGLMEKNEGTLEAAAAALRAGKAITIFPEGKSHSEPQLADIKTGCARIALRAAKGGTSLRVVPVGLTYAQKHLFRSQVRVELGEPILVQVVGGLSADQEQEWVRDLTAQVGDALRGVTLSLESWEDLELIDTADQLYALRNGVREKDPERLRVMAKAAALLRNERPDFFDDFKEDVMSFRARLKLVNAAASDLLVHYQPLPVVAFAARNLAALLLGLPLFALGMALFAAPYSLVRALGALAPVSEDRVGTFKLITTMIVGGLWWTGLGVLGWLWHGTAGLAVAVAGAFPLALYTRYFVERLRNVLVDVRVFLTLGNRKAVKQQLLFQGERLQDELQRLEREVLPKLGGSSAG